MVVKSENVRWVGYVARIGAMRKVNKVVVLEPEGA
jgi:hypothetical protein